MGNLPNLSCNLNSESQLHVICRGAHVLWKTFSIFVIIIATVAREFASLVRMQRETFPGRFSRNFGKFLFWLQLDNFWWTPFSKQLVFREYNFIVHVCWHMWLASSCLRFVMLSQKPVLFVAVNNSLDIGRKWNVHKTFRRRPGRLMYIQFTSCVQGEEKLSFTKTFTYLKKHCLPSVTFSLGYFQRRLFYASFLKALLLTVSILRPLI